MQGIVERRIDRVPESGRPPLEVAATLGRQLDLPVMQQLMPQLDLDTWLMECANAAVLEAQGGEWRFCHDKLREAIPRYIEPTKRQRLHKEVAEAMEAAYAIRRRDVVNPTLAY